MNPKATSKDSKKGQSKDEKNDEEIQDGAGEIISSTSSSGSSGTTSSGLTTSTMGSGSTSICSKVGQDIQDDPKVDADEILDIKDTEAALVNKELEEVELAEPLCEVEDVEATLQQAVERLSEESQQSQGKGKKKNVKFQDSRASGPFQNSQNSSKAQSKNARWNKSSKHSRGQGHFQNYRPTARATTKQSSVGYMETGGSRSHFQNSRISVGPGQLQNPQPLEVLDDDQSLYCSDDKARPRSRSTVGQGQFQICRKTGKFVNNSMQTDNRGPFQNSRQGQFQNSQLCSGQSGEEGQVMRVMIGPTKTSNGSQRGRPSSFFRLDHEYEQDEQDETEDDCPCEMCGCGDCSCEDLDELVYCTPDFILPNVPAKNNPSALYMYYQVIEQREKAIMAYLTRKSEQY